MHGKHVKGGAFKLELFDGINVFVSWNEHKKDMCSNVFGWSE
jgi:hypothetical protein